MVVQCPYARGLVGALHGLRLVLVPQLLLIDYALQTHDPVLVVRVPEVPARKGSDQSDVDVGELIVIVFDFEQVLEVVICW